MAGKESGVSQLGGFGSCPWRIWWWLRTHKLASKAWGGGLMHNLAFRSWPNSQENHNCNWASRSSSSVWLESYLFKLRKLWLCTEWGSLLFLPGVFAEANARAWKDDSRKTSQSLSYRELLHHLSDLTCCKLDLSLLFLCGALGLLLTCFLCRHLISRYRGEILTSPYAVLRDWSCHLSWSCVPKAIHNL